MERLMQNWIVTGGTFCPSQSSRPIRFESNKNGNKWTTSTTVILYCTVPTKICVISLIYKKQWVSLSLWFRLTLPLFFMSFQNTVLRKSAYLRYEDSRRVLLLDSVCRSTGLDRFAVHGRKCRALLQWQYRNASLLASDNATAPVQVELQQVGMQKICCTFQQVTTPCCRVLMMSEQLCLFSEETAQSCNSWRQVSSGFTVKPVLLETWSVKHTYNSMKHMLSILDWKQSVCGNQLSSRKRRLLFSSFEVAELLTIGY